MSTELETKKAVFKLWVIHVDPNLFVPLVRVYHAMEIRKTGATVLTANGKKFIRKTKNLVFYTTEEDMYAYVRTHLSLSVNRLQQQLVRVSDIAGDLSRLTILQEPSTALVKQQLKLQ